MGGDRRRVAPRNPPRRLVLCLDEHIYAVARQLHVDEIAGVTAISGVDYDGVRYARQLCLIPRFRFTLLDESGRPVAIGGFRELGPGIFQLWGGCTQDGWSRYWRSITKSLRWLANELLQTEARRIEVLAIASREPFVRWCLRSLGMEHEGVFRCRAANGEDVVSLAIIPAFPACDPRSVRLGSSYGSVSLH